MFTCRATLKTFSDLPSLLSIYCLLDLDLEVEIFCLDFRTVFLSGFAYQTLLTRLL